VPAGRYGLVGLNERARLLGGTLRLESSPGAGTRVEVVIPLERQM
jgi:signal transduction histidine kinase